MKSEVSLRFFYAAIITFLQLDGVEEEYGISILDYSFKSLDNIRNTIDQLFS